MRRWVLAAAVWAAALACGGAALAGEDARKLSFPKAASGAVPLAVDLHTHSVFSDGHVWPTVRTWEAEKDGLFAYAVTEHLEFQPYQADIPHKDRNRSHQVALAAQKMSGRSEGPLILNGAEITRDMPPGHINAVFIADANKLKVRRAEASIKAANDQGGFVFWNHPYWMVQAPDGVTRLGEFHRDLIAKKQLHGIEVANGKDFSKEALAIALEHNLVVLGTSDIHGLIDYDYHIAGGEHRTVTLALAAEASEAGLKEALKAGRTVAYYKGNFIGREEHVRDVVLGALSLGRGPFMTKTTILNIELRNAAPADMLLRLVGGGGFYNSGSVITVPARGNLKLMLRDVADADALKLEFEVLNSFIAPDKHLAITLAPLTS
jgi:hypothetical protein